MQMLYNSDAFAVVEITVPPSAQAVADADDDFAPPTRDGFEIVDKMARTDIFLVGAIARQFRAGVEELSKGDPTPDQVDEYISRYTGLPQQPLILH